MRKRKLGISVRIRMGEWREYFEEIFIGSDERKTDNCGSEVREEEGKDLKNEKIRE